MCEPFKENTPQLHGGMEDTSNILDLNVGLEMLNVVLLARDNIHPYIAICRAYLKLTKLPSGKPQYNDLWF